MSRIYRNKKEYEQFLIREFLGNLGYKISNPVWQESPDSLVTLSKRNIMKRIAIEHTDYFNDTRAGRRSLLTPIDEFWKDVQNSLAMRISHRRHLSGIIMNVQFKDNLQKPSNPLELSMQLAKELVDFMESHPVRKSGTLSFRNHQFNSIPLMEDMLSSISLLWITDESYLASRCNWICSNITTGWVEISLEYIKSAIGNKNKKAINYKWNSAEEKWLLIAASGIIISNKAGPATQNVNWSDYKLFDLCCRSPFDRIVFWERSRNWYKWLKPSRKIKNIRK
jgi:hypothetical protein